MRFRAFAVALGLGGLAATPCLALTVQAAPPRPDIAQHLRSTSVTTTFGALPGPGELKDSFVASGRPQLGQGFYGPAGVGPMSFSAGPFSGANTVTPAYGGSWNGAGFRGGGNPLSLVPPRH
jgi:hypothetical protein